ncbi:uncharacterized protein LOC131152664 isoform X1 [Malania oleifera]|uniref:uncharacterized protein LOC131152664 isoform X1 n=1 Tax=Malania oleifera TaxID=397392 RepID=UPI0025AE59E3|nr:uncharacterized protein LOC131152664 isoform X1 [Malania oleifera]
MGGGNGQKAKMAREKNLEKQKAAKGSQLESNKKAMTIQVNQLGERSRLAGREAVVLPFLRVIQLEQQIRVKGRGDSYTALLEG